MQTPGGGRASQDDHNAESGVMPAASQGLSDFVARCAALGWAVEPVSRVIKLTGTQGSVLLASAASETFPDTLRRIGAANDFAKRSRRP
jgi:hypothetical protein